MSDENQQLRGGKPNELLSQARRKRNWTLDDVAKRVGTVRRTVERWESGETSPSRAFQDKLSLIFHMDPTELGFRQFEQRSPEHFNVPYLRNHYFTGRKRTLEELYHALVTNHATELPVAICGLAGMGKTQLALEYAYQYGSHYETVFWVRADSRDLLLTDFVTIAGILNLPEKHEQNQEVVIHAVKQWLSQQKNFLLIMDDVDDLDMISTFLPRTENGHVLLTTRTQLVGTSAMKFDLERMEKETGATFLLRRAKIIAPDASLDRAPAPDVASALNVAQAMDGLPLALDQAGAYIDGGRCGVAEYFDLYQKRKAVLLRERGSPHGGHPASVMTTFTLLLERLQQEHEVAAFLLNLCAFLHPDAIPRELIIANLYTPDPLSGRLVLDPILGHQAIDALLRYSLVRQLTDQRTFSMHRLVQDFMKETMGTDAQELWATLAIGTVYQALIDSGQETMQGYERYLASAELCAGFIHQWRFHFSQAVHLLVELGRYLRTRASYTQAEHYCRQALAVLEEMEAPKPIDRAMVFSNLGHVYQMQGKYELAEPYFERTIAILEEEPEWSKKDPQWNSDALLAVCLSNLARCYQDEWKLKKAEKTGRQALTLVEKARGPEHPEVAHCLMTLATIYREQERYEQAEQLYRQALKIYENALEPQVVQVAHSLNNLATIYVALGKYEESEPLNRRALTILQQVRGPEHPEVARCLVCLSDFYQYRRDWPQAEQLNQQALSMYLQTVGGEHKEVMMPLINLALFAQRQGRYEQAQEWYRQALDIAEKYPLTEEAYQVAHHYAQLLALLNQPEEAARYKVRAEEVLSRLKARARS